MPFISEHVRFGLYIITSIFDKMSETPGFVLNLNDLTKP